MNKDKKDVVLAISSWQTSRLYAIVFKNYLQREYPHLNVKYFISQQDSTVKTLRKAALEESRLISKNADVIISLDGEVPSEMYNGTKAKKILYYIKEAGIPKNKELYFSGFDALVLPETELYPIFAPFCQKHNIELEKSSDIIGNELSLEKNRSEARTKLETFFPEIEGKKILAILTRGKCKKNRIEKYKQLDITKFVSELPDDVSVMTNCPQLKSAADMVSGELAEKFVLVEERDILETLLSAEWLVSNMSLSAYSPAKKMYIRYADSKFEQSLNKAELVDWNSQIEEKIKRLLKK